MTCPSWSAPPRRYRLIPVASTRSCRGYRQALAPSSLYAKGIGPVENGAGRTALPQQLMTMTAPVLALVLWTFVMWFWMYATRIPAMRKAGIDPAKIKGSESLGSMPPLPPKVVWVADNYNHLHEQPTVFYALAIYTHLAGVADELNIALAWIYVALRIVHSLVQAITNFVPTRFYIFAAASLVLMWIAIRDVLALFGV
jgi:hypothetical protein